MELEFGQDAYHTEFDKFMRHYLTIKTGRIPKIDDVYEEFKNYSRILVENNENVQSLVSDINKFSEYYCAMTLNTEKDKLLQLAFNDLKELKVDVAYPMLLELYDDYENTLLNRDDFLKIARLIESYVFRRNICAIPTNSLNKIFATFMKNVDKNNYLQSVNGNFKALPSYRRFPGDNEFMHEFSTRDLYNMHRRSYWLRRIENFNRKERVIVEQYTIEHTMPQNRNLSKEWRRELGIEWKRIQEIWLHTLGNLTLTGYNFEYSDRSFNEKCEMENGFFNSPLKLNGMLSKFEVWNEQSIIDRGKALSNLAIQVWSSPVIDFDAMDNFNQLYLNKLAILLRISKYIDKNNPYFVEKVSVIFENLRKEIISIDKVVVEEYLKLYIAYKAETNFVDIVPQAKNLKLF